MPDMGSQQVATPPATRGRRSGPRGPNAVRRQATRNKLLEATIECLYRHGYFGTSTVLVTEVAGVSRGSLLHQFPTKVDLMVATAEHIIDNFRSRHLEEVSKIDDDHERFRAIPEITWKMISSPWGIARIELALASRSDPEFAHRMTPLVERMDRTSRESIWGLVARLGVRNRDKVDTMVRLYIAALRGLAIEDLYDYAKPNSPKAVELLVRYNEWFLEELKREAQEP